MDSAERAIVREHLDVPVLSGFKQTETMVYEDGKWTMARSRASSPRCKDSRSAGRGRRHGRLVIGTGSANRITGPFVTLRGKRAVGLEIHVAVVLRGRQHCYVA